MILDVFPSYKDNDMVDLLYQFERATGLSLNILVEKYLEKVLYEEGYLTVDINEESSENSRPIIKETNKSTSNTNKGEYLYFDKTARKYRVQRLIKQHNYSFGSYDSYDDAKKVRDFLISKNWDIKYAGKNCEFKGDAYRRWIFSEIKKEQSIVKEDK